MKKKREGEPQTCPRRMEEVGPWDREENLDVWDTSNWKFTDEEEAAKYNQERADKDNAEAKAKGWNSTTVPNLRYYLWPEHHGGKPRICSFCGCIHPEDAIRLVKDHQFEVERSDKGYKVYLHPPGYRHSMEITLNRLRKRMEPEDVSEYNEIYPPLKAYSPHFTRDQWTSLCQESGR